MVDSRSYAWLIDYGEVGGMRLRIPYPYPYPYP